MPENPRENPVVSPLAQLVALLLVLVGVLVVGGLAYLAYRHPVSRDPLLVGLMGMAVLSAIVMPIVIR
jgi:hypothetical protein